MPFNIAWKSIHHTIPTPLLSKLKYGYKYVVPYESDRSSRHAFTLFAEMYKIEKYIDLDYDIKDKRIDFLGFFNGKTNKVNKSKKYIDNYPPLFSYSNLFKDINGKIFYTTHAVNSVTTKPYEDMKAWSYKNNLKMDILDSWVSENSTVFILYK